MGDEPPCGECPRVDPLIANDFAWRLYCRLSSSERPLNLGMGGAVYMPIPLTAIMDVVERAGGSEADIDKILYLDSLMLPWIREQNNKSGSKRSKR